jgi:hypothetical protein
MVARNQKTCVNGPSGDAAKFNEAYSRMVSRARYVENDRRLGIRLPILRGRLG